MLNIFSNLCPNRIARIVFGFLFVPGMSQAQTWVFTDRANPVNAPANVRTILLDEQARIEMQLSRELPTDPSQAAATIQSYLTSPAGQHLQRDLAKAQQGLTDAWSLGVEKIPAVVVDRRYVIYGESDVAKAVERINQARSASQ